MPHFFGFSRRIHAGSFSSGGSFSVSFSMNFSSFSIIHSIAFSTISFFSFFRLYLRSRFAMNLLSFSLTFLSILIELILTSGIMFY